MTLFLRVILTRIFHTDASRGAANPDADTTGGPRDRGGDCPEFVGSLSLSLSLKQTFKGRDELCQASQRRRAF